MVLAAMSWKPRHEATLPPHHGMMMMTTQGDGTRGTHQQPEPTYTVPTANPLKHASMRTAYVTAYAYNMCSVFHAVTIFLLAGYVS